MKRMIVFLLVLLSFTITHAEELNTEQQQLAWKFIYENMLAKEYLPNIFKEDISINLRGEITSEDSIVVKDLIKSFQKAIPHLKINLSDKKGNLILGLNDGKNNRVTTNLSANNTISTIEMYFPSDLNPSQRKQFLYFHLFKGLVFYNFPKENIPGMKGCVFAEQDYQTITYSPFDLFILEKLYATDFSIQLALNLPTELQERAWDNIRWKFLGSTKTPVIYRTDIALKLTGTVSQSDSMIVKEVIDQIKLIIPNRKVYYTNSKPNLEINLIDPLSGTIFRTSNDRSNSDILSRKIEINLSSFHSQEEIKKVLYYYITRALVDLSLSSIGSMTIPGSVFDEKVPQNITYTPIDAFVINKLYADDFQEQFKNDWIKRWPARSYYTFMYSSQLRTGGIVAGIILAILIFSILIRRGIFKFHEWKLSRFFVQIIWIPIIIDLYFIVSLSIQNLDFIHITNQGPLIVYFIFINLTFIIVPLVFFLTENKIDKLNLTPKNKLLYLILNSFSIPFIISMVCLIPYNSNNIGYKLTFSFGISFIVVSIRFLLFTISEIKRNELKAKDLELTLLREKNKQAELQSLRAKINPHFLYNALNSIASLATTDGRKTEQMALSLSDFFKYAINREQKQLNTLSEELNAIRTYLEIEKVRFGERLDFRIDCPAELMEVQIPQLLIQPLVENAIKHGLSKITDKGLIRVSVSKEGSQLKIRVYDNGPAFPDGPLSGFGLQNTQERINLVYGAKAGINWQNSPDKYIEISIQSNNKQLS